MEREAGRPDVQEPLVVYLGPGGRIGISGTGAVMPYRRWPKTCAEIANIARDIGGREGKARTRGKRRRRRTRVPADEDDDPKNCVGDCGMPDEDAENEYVCIDIEVRKLLIVAPSRKDAEEMARMSGFAVDLGGSIKNEKTWALTKCVKVKR